MIFKRLVLIGLAVLLAGCAMTPTPEQIAYMEQIKEEERIQREMAFNAYWDDRLHLDRVMYEIQKAAVPVCFGSVHSSIGAIFSTLSDWDYDWRDIVKARLGVIDNGWVVSRVLPGSPAEMAGVKVGDKLIHVNGKPVTMIRIKMLRSIRNSIENNSSVLIGIMRDNKNLELRVGSSEVCDFPVELVEGETINASADGRYVYVNTGVMRFIQSDDELALVLAHEFAHNIMGHSFRRSLPVVVRETEADYVGMFILYYGGYPLDKVGSFWRKVAVAMPSGIHGELQSGYPSTSDRFISIKKYLMEIGDKQKKGGPVLPYNWRSEGP